MVPQLNSPKQDRRDRERERQRERERETERERERGKRRERLRMGSQVGQNYCIMRQGMVGQSRC